MGFLKNLFKKDVEVKDKQTIQKDELYWIISSESNQIEKIYLTATGGWFPYTVKLKYIKDDVSGEEFSSVFGVTVFTEKSLAYKVLSDGTKTGKIPADYNLKKIDKTDLKKSLLNLSKVQEDTNAPKLLILMDPAPKFAEIKKIFQPKFF